MSDTRSPIIWNSLVRSLETAKYGEIHEIQSGITKSTPETSQASHSNTGRRLVAETVRTLDHQRCFVTNESGDVEVAHLLDNSGNGQLVDALRGLGVVHYDFNIGDISNLLLISRNLHFLWKKYAAFIIVPSMDTRERMIEILVDDRERLSLALESKVVEPQQLAYPESVTYDIILARPSLFGDEHSHFQRADNHDDNPTYYRIPKLSDDPYNRLEYLTKQDDEAHVSEFLNILHVTGRSSRQAINPYLMVLNALQKLNHWAAWGIGDATFPTYVPHSVFTTAVDDCRLIRELIGRRMHGTIHMSRGNVVFYGYHLKTHPFIKEYVTVKLKDAKEVMYLKTKVEKKLPWPQVGIQQKNRSRLRALHHNPSTHPGNQSWISRGNFDKMHSLENWRQEVSEFRMY